MSYFSITDAAVYEGPESQNPWSYRYYQPDEIIRGKSMRDWLRAAVCYWHTLCWDGQDAFGGGTRHMPWQRKDPMDEAKEKANVIFDIAELLQIPYFTFHDRDIAPEGDTLKQTEHNLMSIVDILEKNIADRGTQLLWGTANLFSHPRYMAGAATNPNPEVFLMGARQVKLAMDITKRLGGANYVLWGGREGYDSLLNTNLKQEAQQFARFLHMVADYKHQIGFKGMLLIEPKPCEPTKHQYDYDVATVYGFLCQHGLEKEYQVNIEANHATLSGHSFEHEVAQAYALGCFGSIDANRGDPHNGWDTDQFPGLIGELFMVMCQLMQHGGFTTGGFNFDTKIRRQSIDPDDILYGHLGGMDRLAKCLRLADRMLDDDQIAAHQAERYKAWGANTGQAILNGDWDLATCAEQVTTNNIDPQPISARQEYLENIMARYMDHI